MLKVIIFDSGSGGEAIADFFEEELPVVEFVRVIDYQHAPYNNKSLSEIFELVSQALRPHIQSANAIVLADYLPSLIIDRLRSAYPEQNFVGLSPNLSCLSKTRLPPKKMVIFASQAVLNSDSLKAELNQLNIPEVVTVDCGDIGDLIDYSRSSSRLLRERLEEYYDSNLDAAFLGDTHLWSIIPELEDIFGWRVRLIDQKRELLHNLCRALKLLGVDGRT